jgi:hypothetical protein
MSIGALRAIERARELWMIDLGPPNQERSFLRRHLDDGRPVVNLYGLYQLPDCPRALFYVAVAQRLLHLARRGRRITFLCSGNPLWWVSLTAYLKRWAHLVDVRITPSMSFLDVMHLETPFVSDTLQLRLSTIRAPNISPDLDCVIGQLGDDSTSNLFGRSALAELCADLRRHHGARHPVFLFGNHSVDGAPVARQTTVAGLPGALAGLGAYHVSALVPARGFAGRDRIPSALSYLFADPRQD